jgi:predicted SAM-dependent methyltransferase
MKLIIGSGPGYQHQDGVIAIDYIAAFNPDIVWDITHGLPLTVKLDDQSFTDIEIHHVLEHIETNAQFKRLMTEMFNVLTPGGLLDITVPHWKSDIAVECFEHVRFFNENSFMNFYNNPYAKEMGLPLFELVLSERRPKDGGEEVHTILKKPV